MILVKLLLTVIIGGVCGCIAGNIMDTNGGLARSIIFGVIGGFVGGILLSVLGAIGLHFSGILGWIMNIVFGVIGSCGVIWAAKKFL